MIFNQIESYGSWSNTGCSKSLSFICSKFTSFMEIFRAQYSNRQTFSVLLVIFIKVELNVTILDLCGKVNNINRLGQIYSNKEQTNHLLLNPLCQQDYIYVDNSAQYFTVQHSNRVAVVTSNSRLFYQILLSLICVANWRTKNRS